MDKLCDEVVIEILMYLRAADLAALCETNKQIFSHYRIGTSILRMIRQPEPLLPLATPSPQKKILQRILDAKTLPRPESLYAFEVANILSALAYPQPLTGKGKGTPRHPCGDTSLRLTGRVHDDAQPTGYWISSAWVSNAKKFFESTPLTDIVESALASAEIASATAAAAAVAKPADGVVPAASQVLKTPLSKGRGRYPGSGENSPMVGPASSTSKRKGNKIRRRRGSDALPPWLNINAELVCAHDGLSSHKVPTAKRRAISGKAWRLLRRYYPQGPSFPVAHVSECAVCLSMSDEAKLQAMEKKESTLQQRRAQWCPAGLQALFQRSKQGVPTERLSAAHHLYLVEDADEDGNVQWEPVLLPSSALLGAATTASLPMIGAAGIAAVGQLSASGTTTTAAGSRAESPIASAPSSSSSASFSTAAPPAAPLDVDSEHHHTAAVMSALTDFAYPLSPGQYFLLPRDWLKQWRRYLRDTSLTHPPTASPAMECTRLLCVRHGHLMVPSHVEDYLVGIKRGLLSGLGDYVGEVVELVTLEEWETLQDVSRSAMIGGPATSSSGASASLLAASPTRLFVGRSDALAGSPRDTTSPRTGDFSVSFTITAASAANASSVRWNIPVCHVCDPVDAYREADARLRLR